MFKLQTAQKGFPRNIHINLHFWPIYFYHVWWFLKCVILLLNHSIKSQKISHFLSNLCHRTVSLPWRLWGSSFSCLNDEKLSGIIAASSQKRSHGCFEIFKNICIGLFWKISVGILGEICHWKNPPFSIGNTSSNGGFFHWHLSFQGGICSQIGKSTTEALDPLFQWSTPWTLAFPSRLLGF